MKKIKITILFLLNISTCSFAQIEKSDLLGTWTNTYTEMKDGSKLIPVYPDYVKHFEMTFSSNKLATNYHPAEEKQSSSNSYQLKNASIEISMHLGYEIEKLSNDSLVIVEKMKWLEDDQLKKFFLVKKEKLQAIEKSKQESKHLTANPYYTPKFKQSIELYLNEGLNKKHTNLKLIGELIILLDDKEVSVNISDRDNFEPIQEQIITDLLEDSYKKWNLKGLEEYSSITIDFVIIMEHTKTYRGLRMELNTDSFTQLLGLYGLTYEQQFDGNKYFNLGITSFEAGNYENAINNFTKSFELNHTKVEALYNRAATFLHMEKYEEACKDWEILKDLGQKQGEKLFNENCNDLKD